jgi:hypothetical protein
VEIYPLSLPGDKMPKRQSPPSKSQHNVTTASDWSQELAKTMEVLGATTLKYPHLLPQGVHKIELELELELEPGVVCKLLIEGPTAGSASLHGDSRVVSAKDAFEMLAQPQSLLTRDSPAAGLLDDQRKLSPGKSIEGAARVFEKACAGIVSTYQNNCAHYLSNAFMNVGFDELTKAQDYITHRCGKPECISGGKRPTRAKDMFAWFKTKDSKPVSAVKKGSGFYAVYQERQSDGQGHVVILDTNTWKFYGTGWFEAGQPAPEDWKHTYFRW